MPATPPAIDARTGPPARAEAAPRFTPLAWALALGCGAILWYVGLRSGGFDWYISETHAHIIYSALRRFREVPLFSFYLNQGSYLIQDPQFPLLSITTPLVLAFGPEAGLRFAGFVWGAAGFWAFFAWGRRHVADRAAAFGAVSWVLGLGILWRIAVGNDMFLWFLALPLLLLLTEDVIETGRPRAALRLGLVAGLCVLGPAFHAITYLLAPACALYALVALPRRPWSTPAYAVRLGLLALAILVMASVALPRLVAWKSFDMRRVIDADGTMAIGATVASLVSPFKTSPNELIRVEGLGPQDGKDPVYGIWESAVGLPGAAALLAVGGLVAGARAGRRRLWLFAALCVAAGIALTTSAFAWDAIRSLVPSLRVSRRFLIVSSFGLSTLAAIGYAELEARWRRLKPGALLAAALLVTLTSTGAWIHLATRDRLLQPSAAPPIAHPAVGTVPVPTMTARKVPSAIASGRILADVFFSVGNPCLGGFLGGFRCADYSARVWQGPLGAGWAEYPVVFPIDAPVTVTHTSVRLGRLAPGQQVELRLLARPALGYVGEVSPANAALQVQGHDETFTVTNVGTVPVEQARLAPRLPMPAWLWAAWACLVCVVGFGALEPRRREAVSEAPRAAA